MVVRRQPVASPLMIQWFCLSSVCTQATLWMLSTQKGGKTPLNTHLGLTRDAHCTEPDMSAENQLAATRWSLNVSPQFQFRKGII